MKFSKERPVAYTWRMLIEYFGTLMSVVIAVSLMQKNIRWLRIINAAGAAGFSVYGAMIGAWPVMALNTFIFFIDIWFLFRMRNSDEHFDYLEVDGLKSVYVRKFIEFNRQEIAEIIPEFNPDDRENVKGCLILRDIRPVSLILYRPGSGGAGEILLDYSVPSYRDFKNARYFFNYVLRHVDLGGITRLTAQGSTPIHRRYLEKIGFQPVGKADGRNLYSLDIIESP